MKPHTGLILTLCLALTFSLLLPLKAAGAENASELFVQGYEAVELGLKREREGKLQAAMERYRAAVTRFERLKQKFPDWNPSAVDTRIQRTTAMITGLQVSLDKQLGSSKELSADTQTNKKRPAAARKRN